MYCLDIGFVNQIVSALFFVSRNTVVTGEVLYAGSGWQAYRYGTIGQYRNCPSGYPDVLNERTSKTRCRNNITAVPM